MPTYTYECEHCGIFDIEHSILDKAIEECPKCGLKGLKRLIGSNTNFILNGNGWAKDNYTKIPGSGSGGGDKK
jgi:putative FmdB family regulatory protein